MQGQVAHSMSRSAGANSLQRLDGAFRVAQLSKVERVGVLQGDRVGWKLAGVSMGIHQLICSEEADKDGVPVGDLDRHLVRRSASACLMNPMTCSSVNLLLSISSAGRAPAAVARAE